MSPRPFFAHKFLTIGRIELRSAEQMMACHDSGLPLDIADFDRASQTLSLDLAPDAGEIDEICRRNRRHAEAFLRLGDDETLTRQTRQRLTDGARAYARRLSELCDVETIAGQQTARQNIIAQLIENGGRQAPSARASLA